MISRLSTRLIMRPTPNIAIMIATATIYEVSTQAI
jgi:hypothetical protein